MTAAASAALYRNRLPVITEHRRSPGEALDAVLPRAEDGDEITLHDNLHGVRLDIDVTRTREEG